MNSTHLETTLVDWLANGSRYVRDGITSVRITCQRPAVGYVAKLYRSPTETITVTPKSEAESDRLYGKAAIAWAKDQFPS